MPVCCRAAYVLCGPAAARLHIFDKTVNIIDGYGQMIHIFFENILISLILFFF